jgi:polar amino acid transport system substrate-binding protein/cystine transport system substrate-binding protein/membrane-bound lytic murein transglycosylase F
MANWLPRWRDVIAFAGLFGLLGAVYLLPPDTALRNVRAAGVLRVCMPVYYPPLVTGDPAAPGIDVEMLQAIAQDIGVRLATVANPAMGRDFNPRAWRITRAQCEVFAGGVVGSATTRSFLDTTPAYATTGWAMLAIKPGWSSLQGRRVGVLVPLSGLDRIALSTYLRRAKAQVAVTLNIDELVQGLANGRFDVGITERLLAAEMAAQRGWSVHWMPAELTRYPVVLGLWKGDLTLKRAIASAMAGLQNSGRMANIVAHYTTAASAYDDERPDSRLDRSK